MVDPQFWTIFIPLLCAHVAGDFLLQTDAAVKRKRDVSVLLKHVLILSVLSYLLVGILGAWQLVVVIFISHALIDTVKTRSNRNNLTVFLLDQCVHVLILILTAYLVVRWQLYPLEGVWLQWLGTAYLDGLILFTGAVSCIYVGGFVVAYRVAPSPEKLEGSEPRTGEREGGVEAP
ncbi:MAG: DUF3307 domain-containing protein, partial [Anaerolineales bacterium]|nr:DUF3307 domain-containing protein [Anaerolineales bacterium]